MIYFIIGVVFTFSTFWIIGYSARRKQERINSLKEFESDTEHLLFIYHRMHQEHEENKNYDYMIRLEEIIDKREAEYWSK